jgi:hypothetical protein
MNEHTRRLLSHLESHRAVLREALESVPEPLRETRPEPERWSAAEVLEHLLIIERRVAAMLANDIATLPPLSVAPSSQPDQFTERLKDRSQRVNAPERLLPAGSLSASEAWRQLTEARAELCRLIESADDRDLTVVRRTHPVLGEMDLYEWLGTLGSHEARHALQIREAAAKLAAS